jgi:hypothetical protein
MTFQNAFNTGRDIAIDFVLPQGPVRFSILTDVSRKQNTKSVESHGIDGICRYVEIPGGYEGTVEIDRAGPQLDQAIAYLESLYYAGKPVPYSTITETISELNGSITIWRFVNVAIKAEDLGSWKGDSKVTQKLGWKASLRQRVQ